MSFTIIDWFFSVVVIIFSLVGLSKGFINNIFGKLSWILAILCGCLFYDDAALLFLQNIHSTVLQNILGFLLIFVLVFLIVKIVQMIFSKIFEWNILKSLDRTLGFIFGIIEGLVIVGLFIFILKNQPFFATENLFAGSFFAELFNYVLVNSKDVSINV